MSNDCADHAPLTRTLPPPDDLPEADLLTIGALASLSQVTVRTLRYYEELDLILPVGRTQGRYRLYHPRTLKRIKAITALQDLNFSLEEILTMLGPASPLTVVTDKHQRLALSRDALSRQKAGVEAKLARLEALYHDLEHRLSILQTECGPCASVTPESDCNDHCQHRPVHVD